MYTYLCILDYSSGLKLIITMICVRLLVVVYQTIKYCSLFLKETMFRDHLIDTGYLPDPNHIAGKMLSEALDNKEVTSKQLQWRITPMLLIHPRFGWHCTCRIVTDMVPAGTLSSASYAHQFRTSQMQIPARFRRDVHCWIQIVPRILQHISYYIGKVYFYFLDIR